MGLYDDYANGGGSSLYGGYSAPQTAAPAKPASSGINFGTIAHGFLSGLAHAAAHPVRTAKDMASGLVSSAVNDVKTIGDFIPTAAKGTYHTVAAGVDAATGNKAAALKQMEEANKTYNNSYIGKTYGSKSKGDLSGLGNAGGFAIDAATAGAGGSLVKQGAKEALKVGGDSVIKTMAKGAAKGAAENTVIGAAYGADQAVKDNNTSAKNIEENAAGGAAAGLLAGGLLGGVTHGTGALFNKALHGWANLAAETAHPDAHEVGPKLLEAGDKQLALPAGKKPAELSAGKPSAGALPAESATAPIKTTAGPNGGKFGNEFSTVSPETANKIMALNHTISNFHSEGEKTASHTIDLSGAPGKDASLKEKVAYAGETPTNDNLSAVSKIQTIRNQAATAMDGIAGDRAQMLKSQHDDMGGVSKIKNEDGMVTGRASANDKFYSQYYKENGRPPSRAAWLEEAHRQLQSGTDDQAKHYQAAAQVAEAAHQAYQEKVANLKTTDIYAPKTSAEKAAAAKEQLAATEAQAGQERLGEVHPHQHYDDHEPVDSLLKQLNATENGSKVSQLAILNKLIAHREIDPEHKEAWIAQRDALKPSAKPEAALPEPAKPADSVVETPAASEVRPKAVAQDVNETGQTVHKTSANVNKTEANVNAKESGEVGKESDVAAPKRSLGEKLVHKVTGGKGDGLLNPSRAASREGNVGLARAGADLVSNKRLVTYKAKLASKELRGLMKGLNQDDVNAAIEGATPKDERVAAAAAFFKAHRDAIGESSVDAGTIKGQKENYLPHIARGLESRRGGGANGLKKNTRYNLERQTIEHTDEHGNIVKEDKYKSVDDFEKAVQKIDPKAGAERDTAKLLEHMLITEGHAVENSKTTDRLMDTRMTDGRPALARTTEENLKDQKFNGYKIIDNKLVHPDAKALYEAVTRSGRIDNPFGNALVKANVATKRLVTLNGMVHALNIWKSSFAAQGITRSLWAIVSPGAKQEDFMRAIGYGMKAARASSDNLFDEVGKQTGLLGKFEKVTDPLTHALFHNFGDRQGMSTFLFVEKKAIKAGLTPDEAGRVAADQANQVMHFVPEDQQSIVVRQSAQLALFAGQFLQNTLKTGTNALGIGLDRTLSVEGQRAARKLAISRIGRLFAYSFASAQAINLAATGKYTWQNGNGDPLNPVWYQTKDKYGNTKQYRITNHYGQLKDLAGFILNPWQEAQNKMSPGARELVAQISNTDLFTGDKISNNTQNEGSQIVDRMIHAATNLFTPAGINLASPSKQPGVVQGAKYLGVNSSSAKPNDHYDYTKGASDKKEAQSLIDAYSKGDQSKLAAMQALKAGGNSYFDKFFSQHPELDPTSSNFQGWKANNSKEVSAGISTGFDTAKANGNSLAYMQSIKESGSSYFDKFFTAHPNLDPTSEQYDGSGSKQQAQALKEAKYQQKAAKYAGSKYTKAKAPVRTTVKHTSAKSVIVKPAKTAKLKRIVGTSAIRRRSSKKIGL